MALLDIGNVVNLTTKAPAILGATHKNMKLTGILDYETARKYDEIDLKYRNIFPLLPIGTPDQVELAIYYKFRAENGSTVILADQWIDYSTIDVVTSVAIRITVTDISIQDISRIRDALNALGYQNYNIKQL